MGGELLRRIVEFGYLILSKNFIGYLSILSMCLVVLLLKYIFYREFKCRNILVVDKGNIKFINFRLGKKIFMC